MGGGGGGGGGGSCGGHTRRWGLGKAFNAGILPFEIDTDRQHMRLSALLSLMFAVLGEFTSTQPAWSQYEVAQGKANNGGIQGLRNLTTQSQT